MSESIDIFFFLVNQLVDERPTKGRVLFKTVLGSIICFVAYFVSLVTSTPADSGIGPDGVSQEFMIQIYVVAFATMPLFGYLGTGALAYFMEGDGMQKTVKQTVLQEEYDAMTKSLSCASVRTKLSSFSFFYMSILQTELLSTVLTFVLIILKAISLKKNSSALGYVAFEVLILDNGTAWLKSVRFSPT